MPEHLNIFADTDLPKNSFAQKEAENIARISPAKRRALGGIPFSKIIQNISLPDPLAEQQQEIDKNDATSKLQYGQSSEDFQEQAYQEKMRRYAEVNKQKKQGVQITSTLPQKKGSMSGISKKAMWYTSGGILSYIFGTGLFG